MIINENEEKALLGAMSKRSSGVGLKNSEIGLLNKYDRAMRHGESIMVSPVGKLAPSSHGAKPNIPVENVEGLDAKLRRLGSSEGSQEGSPISVVGSNGKLNLVPAHSTWVTPTDFPTELGQSNYPAYFDANITGVLVKNLATSYQLNINVADITKNMTIKEVDVCDSGTPKKMLIIASAPYV